MELRVISPPRICIKYVSWIVLRIAPSRGHFRSDVAGILRGILKGKSKNEVVIDFYAFVFQEVALDRGVSVIRGPSHTRGKTGASFPLLVTDAHMSPLNNP